MSRNRHQPPGQGSTKLTVGAWSRNPRDPPVSSLFSRKIGEAIRTLAASVKTATMLCRCGVVRFPPFHQLSYMAFVSTPCLPAAARSPAMCAPIMKIDWWIRGSRFGIDRVVERRDEQAGASAPHLVDVVEDRREPFLVEQVRQQPGLFQVEHEPVAVRVVPGVLVIELGQAAPFPGLPLRSLIPVRDLVHAVGVGRGDEQEDRLSRGSHASRGRRSEASSCSSSIAIRVDAVSVEWIEQVITTTGLLSGTGSRSPPSSSS